MNSALALFLLALVVRLGFLALFPDPAYPDSYYYTDVARSIVAGNGFNVDFIWIFAEVGGRLPDPAVLPIPSNAHWMPLASIVQVPFLWLFGGSQFAAGLPFAVVGALAAPLAWAIGREAGARPVVCIGAGVLAASPAASAVFFSQPDNFGLFQPLAAGALFLTARALKRRRPAEFVLAGLLVGLATLARNDGVLVGATVGLAFLWDRWRAWRAERAYARIVAGGGLPFTAPAGPMIPFWAAIACFGLFVLAVAPWFARQLAVFGSLLPSSQSGRVLFIRDIGEWNSITTPSTLDYLLGQGIGPLLTSRLGGFVAAVSIYAVLIGSVVLAPLLLIGGWLRRRSVDFGPVFVYAAILFAFSAIVSAVHVPGGTFIHSAVALAPHSYVLALEGVVAVVVWIARRRRHWDESTAAKVFVGGAVTFAIGTSVVFGLLVIRGWDAIRQQRITVAQQLDLIGAAPTDRLMSIDSSGYRYWTGRGGVVTPNDPIATVEEVARAYDIRWLVLERREIVGALQPVLKGTERPTWIGAPAYTLDAPSIDPELAGVPAVGIYPVCFAASDTRCSGTAMVAAP